MRELWLFDVDGVLVDPKGYKFALRDTVNYFADQMGLAPPNLTLDEIASFEAYGLTNEWDSAALSVGVMLADVLELGSRLLRFTLATTMIALKEARLTCPRPDFVAIAQQVAHANNDHEVPTAYCRAVLRDRGLQDALLASLFDDIYDINTPTTRIQQTHTLGSENFAKTYGQPAPFACQSYLLKYDRALLSADSHQVLLEQRNGRDFAIYTARPSLPPTGDSNGYAPEADLAAELLQLAGQVPLIAAGRMDWLARQYGRRAAEYIKPSPVQALAAIGAAAGGDEIQALQAAAALFERGERLEPLASLNGVRVVVFEDSTGGIRAMQQAAALLPDVTVTAYGIAPEASKRAALATVSDRVFDDVNQALDQILSR